MQRSIVLLLALLSIALTGGTCEFRATSGNPPPPPSRPEPTADTSPTRNSVLVASSPALEPRSDSTFAVLAVESIRSTSVLSSPNSEFPDAPNISPSTDPPESIRTVAAVEAEAVGLAPVPVSIAMKDRDPANAIPEPGAFELFAFGLATWAIRIHSRRGGKAVSAIPAE